VPDDTLLQTNEELGEALTLEGKLNDTSTFSTALLMEVTLTGTVTCPPCSAVPEDAPKVRVKSNGPSTVRVYVVVAVVPVIFEIAGTYIW